MRGSACWRRAPTHQFVAMTKPSHPSALSTSRSFPPESQRPRWTRQLTAHQKYHKLRAALNNAVLNGSGAERRSNFFYAKAVQGTLVFSDLLYWDAFYLGVYLRELACRYMVMVGLTADAVGGAAAALDPGIVARWGDFARRRFAEAAALCSAVLDSGGRGSGRLNTAYVRDQPLA